MTTSMADAKMPLRSAHSSWPKSARSPLLTRKVPRMDAMMPAPAIRMGRRAVSVFQSPKGRCRGGQGYGGNYRAHVGLEQVRAHSRYVAHIVAHVVGDDRRVPGVVLGYPGLHLADQVRPHVGGLCVYTSSHPGEQGYGGGPEAEADYVVDVLEDDVQHDDAQQPHADHRDAHHGPAGEGHLKGRVQTAHGGGCGPDVGPDGHAHPDKAGGGGAQGPGQVGDGRAGHPRSPRCTGR